MKNKKVIHIFLVAIFSLFFTKIIYAQRFYAGEYHVKDNVYSTSKLSWKKNQGPLFYYDSQLKKYFNKFFEPQIFNIHDWLKNQLIALNYCPNESYKKNQKFIRYLFRIITLSYITELLKDLSSTELKDNKCSFQYMDVFNSCKPKSKDMKSYLFRLKNSYSQFLNEINIINKSKIRDSFCVNKKCDFQNLCTDLKKLSHLICNESDLLYGQSKYPVLENMLISSSVMSAFDDINMTKSCVRRFVFINSHHEFENNLLTQLYSYVYNDLSSQKSRYLQGVNFIPGALKEFDRKGLSSFLFNLPKPKKIFIVAKLQKTPEIQKIKKLVKIKLSKHPKLKKEIKKRKVKVLSAFEKSRMLVKEYQLKRAKVNLDKFKKQNKYTKRQLANLKIKILKYVTIKKLRQMKKYESFGSSKAPVPLLFIHYLLLAEDHHNLWNMVTIFGEKFYVFNNVDNVKGRVFIELKNNNYTKYKWELNIINENFK